MPNSAQHQVSEAYIIHPKCKNLLNSVAKQTYKEGTVLPDKTQGFDHMNDALGYLFLFYIQSKHSMKQRTYRKIYS
jgi:hypothetical protein